MTKRKLGYELEEVIPGLYVMTDEATQQLHQDIYNKYIQSYDSLNDIQKQAIEKTQIR